MTSDSSISDLSMGLDLGTTSVKVCLYEKTSNSVIRSASALTKASATSDVGCWEQIPDQIFKAVETCILSIPLEERKRVVCIGVSGQMHGVVLWKDGLTRYSNDLCYRKSVSHLFTWQDQRCSQDFLSSLPTPDSHLPVCAGYGCATLFWFIRHDPAFLKPFCHAGSIMDFLVYILCGLEKPVMSEQLCASWGYFNSKSRLWNTEILDKAGFPVGLLPDIVHSGEVAGRLTEQWFGIQAGVGILAGHGDLQCAMFSAIRETHEAALNMSTSFQLGFVVNSEADVSKLEDKSSIQLFPYFNDSYLAVAASLNGGNVLHSFVVMIKSWMAFLGIDIEEAIIWEKISYIVQERDVDSESILRIVPTIFGERHSPNVYGLVSGVTDSNTDMCSVFKALCRGLMENMSRMLPLDILLHYNITRIVATGSVVSKNRLIVEAIKEFYAKLDVVIGDRCDSALGVALVAAKTRQ